MMSYEQFIVTDDEYGRNLPSDGCGFPVNLGQTACPSKCQGRTITPELSLAASPKPFWVASEECPNFATRSREFQREWNYDSNRWEGSITMPVECGPHRPYSSKKAVRTKFIPFISAEQLLFQFKKI